MKILDINTRVIHSESKDAWNVVGTIPGRKYKIARVPYVASNDNEMVNTKNKYEALIMAEYISRCFNNYDAIRTLVDY
ncbi:MAG: hypothetical protein ACLFQA_00265 [Bacteroidales bacterium]